MSAKVPRALTGPVAVGPWLCLTILGLFLANHGEADSIYIAIFKVLLCVAVLTGVGWLVLVVVEQMVWWIVLFPIPLIVLAGFGLVLTRRRAGKKQRPANLPLHVTLLRNVGFVLACTIAAWLGLEAGGKGFAILRSLMSVL